MGAHVDQGKIHVRADSLRRPNGNGSESRLMHETLACHEPIDLLHPHPPMRTAVPLDLSRGPLLVNFEYFQALTTTTLLVLRPCSFDRIHGPPCGRGGAEL